MFLNKYLVGFTFVALVTVVGCTNLPHKVTESEKKIN